MWLRWIQERWSLQQKRNFLFISRAIACSVSFLGVELPGPRVGIVGLVGPSVVVVVVGGFPGLSGFKPPLVIVVVSVYIASVVVVVVADDTSALDSPPGAPVTGDVVVVLVVALSLGRTRPAVTPAATSTPTDILDALGYDWESCVSPC